MSALVDDLEAHEIACADCGRRTLCRHRDDDEGPCEGPYVCPECARC